MAPDHGEDIEPDEFVPRGHFYSPYTSNDDIERALGNAQTEAITGVQGIEIDDGSMIALWNDIVPHMAAANFPDAEEDGEPFFYQNHMYSYGDADVYAGMIGHFKPARIVEIGSGFSSAVAVQTRDRLALKTQITFVEPYPDTLNNLMDGRDWSNVSLIAAPVQDANLQIFKDLEAGDILFVDSSHVAKAGSDVLHEVFRILPLLKPGVIAHFHDCFWPFEYPAPWVRDEKRNWTELYLLRSFLMYNSAFEVLFFNDYFARSHGAIAEGSHPQFLRNPGGGLWLRRH